MRTRFFRALLAAAGILAMLGLVLALPPFMDRVMEGSLAQPRPQALAEEAPTQAVIATASPHATVTPQATPLPLTPAPRETLSPFATVPPWPTPELGGTDAQEEEASEGVALVLLPTPMPAVTEQENSLSPLGWRKWLLREKADVLSAFLPAQERWTQLAGEESAALDQAVYWRTHEGLLLMENLSPRTLAQQKLSQGIADNLAARPIFIPAQDTLTDIQNLPVTSAILRPDGQAATLRLTQGSVFPLPVFLQAQEQGMAPTLQPEKYLSLLNQLLEQAQKQLEDTASMDISHQLVGDMMWDDQPWRLTIVRMEPYVFQADWEYMAAGHHALCLDMETGQQYTLTTDLISGRVIGIATEEAEPFLKTYEGLLAAERQVAQQANSEILQTVEERALQLLRALSGETFDPQHWQLSFSQGRSPESLVWSLDAFPLNANAQRMDPEGQVFTSYFILLNENLDIRTYARNYEPIQSVVSQGFLDDMDETERLEAYAREIDREQPGFSALVERLGLRESFLFDALSQAGTGNMSFSLLQMGGINVTKHTPSNGAPPFWTVSFDAKVQDTVSRRDYWIEIELLGEHEVTLVHLTDRP